MSDIVDEKPRVPYLPSVAEALRMKQNALWELALSNRILGLPDDDCSRTRLSPAAGDPQQHYLREAQYALDSVQIALDEAQQISRGHGRK